MLHPEISISMPMPGQICAAPLDVSSASFPMFLDGDFSMDPEAPMACDPTPFNAVWLTYSPAQDGWYEVIAQNFSTTNPSSSMAIYETSACYPFGLQLTCQTNWDEMISDIVYMEAGTTYLIEFATNYDDETMVDPVIAIVPSADPD
jgi:hypothetical protein